MARRVRGLLWITLPHIIRYVVRNRANFFASVSTQGRRKKRPPAPAQCTAAGLLRHDRADFNRKCAERIYSEVGFDARLGGAAADVGPLIVVTPAAVLALN